MKPENLTAPQIHYGAKAKKDFESGKNPPGWAVDESKWDKAKEAASKSYSLDDDSYWPVVVSIYENMGGTIQGKKAESSNTSTIVNTLIAFENEIAIGEDGWGQIAPFGDFPGMALVPDGKGGFKKEHAIQRIDKTAVASMVNEHQQTATKGIGKYTRGKPVFKGHPDVPGYERRYPDKTPKGIIANLAERENGMYGQPYLTGDGEELIGKGHNRFSGRWEAELVNEENGKKIYRPTRLVSVGLTPTPNLPVELLNAKDDDGDYDSDKCDMASDKAHAASRDAYATSKDSASKGADGHAAAFHAHAKAADAHAKAAIAQKEDGNDEAADDHASMASRHDYRAMSHLQSARAGGAKVSMVNDRETTLANGDYPGHPFHGNQHVSAEESGKQTAGNADKATHQAEAHSESAREASKGAKAKMEHINAAKAHIAAADYHKAASSAHKAEGDHEQASYHSTMAKKHMAMAAGHSAKSEKASMANESQTMDKTKLAARLTALGITISNDASDEDFDKALAKVETTNKDLKDNLREERKARIADMLNTAVADGRITAADKTTWQTRLENEATFANEFCNLANLKKGQIKTKSITIERGDRKVELSNATERREMIGKVVREICNENKWDERKDYDRAFNEAQKRHPALFQKN